MDLKLIMELDAEEELERDGAACVEVMRRDLVEVVRCRECAAERNANGGCKLLNGLVPSDEFFCANGFKGDKSGN